MELNHCLEFLCCKILQFICVNLHLRAKIQFKASRTMIPLDKLVRMEQDQVTLKPFNYIHNVPSIFHSCIVQAFNHWLKAPEDKANQIEEILHIAHTTSLILDDIQDESKFRYGLPSAHHVYSTGLTLNAVTLALGIAFQKVLALGHTEAIKIYLDAYEDCSRGQGIELYWRDNFICPTEEEYIDMLKQKSSIMIVVTIQLLQLFSENREDYQDIAILIGVYYSIRDDYCNLFNRETLKDLADISNTKVQHVYGDSDITDGKFTLPIIHSLQKSENAEEIIRILKERTSDVQLIKHCTSLLEKQGSAKYTENILLRLEKDIENEINRLGDNLKLTFILKKLQNWRRSEE